MTVRLDDASRFIATHARVLDRRRLDLLMGRGNADGVVAALAAYRNADGGYGWGLEPDLRGAESQPVTALHAFEVFEQIGIEAPYARELCDWLDAATLPDGGLPFALPIADPAGSAPFWAHADHRKSSLHVTSMLAGIAHRVGRHDPHVRDHPWLQRATDFSLAGLTELDAVRNAHEFLFVLQFLDAVYEVEPEAPAELRRLGTLMPATGTIPVEGGAAGEALRPMDISPMPDRPVRDLFDPAVIRADLDRLASAQEDDGGWSVDFRSWSPAGALEWRGYATVEALTILMANDRL